LKSRTIDPDVNKRQAFRTINIVHLQKVYYIKEITYIFK